MKNGSVYIVLFLLLPGIASADTLVLKSGKTITGKILSEETEFVQIEFNGMPLYFERKTIRQIAKDSASAAQAETAVACPDADSCLDQGLEVFASLERAGDDDHGQAKELFQQGIAYEPENRDLRGVMAIVGDMEKGAISREYAVSLLSGSYYLMKQEYERGISSLEKALAISPADTNIYYNLGLANHELGRGQQALSHLKKLIELDPGDAQAYGLAGVVCLTVDDRQQAKEYLLIARKLFEKNNDLEKLQDIDSLISASF